MSTTFALDNQTPQFIGGAPETLVRVANGGPGTLYYGSTRDVTSVSNDGSIAAGASESFVTPTWVVTGTTPCRVVAEYTLGSFDVGDDLAVGGADQFSGRITAGYNPSVLLYPTEPKKWNAIDFVMSTGRDRGTGNRLFTRSANLINIGDPPELVFIRGGPKGSPGWGPSGEGPEGWGDGTDIEGLLTSQTIGFVGWMAVVPTSGSESGSHQAFSVVNGAQMTEPSRQDVLTVTLSGDTDAEAETITITGNMDSVAAPVDGTVFPFYEAGTVGISGRQIRYAGRSATKLFGCELLSGSTGTLSSGANVNQTRTQAGGNWTVNTAVRTTGQRLTRIRIGDDGLFGIGDFAINAGLSKFFTVGGGASHFKELRNIENLEAEIIGTPGTTSITYKVIGVAPDGSRLDPVSVTTTEAPATLNTTNYVKLTWTGGTGCTGYDIVRSATAGSPGTTGAIILNQPWIRGPRAVDYGLAPTGQDEVQEISFTNADAGTFRLEWGGNFTDPLDVETVDADAVKDALEALAGIAVDDLTVTGSLSINSFEVSFGGTLADTNVALMGVEDIDLIYIPGTDEPYKTPKVSTRTLTQGTPASYVEPTRNETGDVTVDGRLTVGSLATDGTAAGSTLGTVTGSMEVFDADGNSVGFMPIYDAIT